MSSVALTSWNTVRASRLDHLRQAHQQTRQTNPGGTIATQALSSLFVLLLASEFQGFARELHDEAADFLASTIALGNQGYFTLIRNNLVIGRELDRQNAKPSTLATDFERFGIADLWGDITSAVASGNRWKAQLDRLNTARNAIVHNQPGKLQLLKAQGFPITIATIQSWRAACNGVSRNMDATLKKHIKKLTGLQPW